MKCFRCPTPLARPTRGHPLVIPAVVPWLLALAVAGTATAAQAPLFMGDFLSFGVGNGPVAIANADLNADGHTDLVSANTRSNTISVVLGNGKGLFGPPTDYPTGSRPSSLAIADLNGDGIPDIVVTDAGSNAVSVFLGKGDGTFGSRTDYAVGIAPSSVAVGDLSGDGIPDLVVADQGTAQSPSNLISVLLGNGNGTFQAKIDGAVGYGPSAVVLGDFDRDGFLDVAVANKGYASSPGATVSVLLAWIYRGFSRRTDYAAPTSPQCLAYADIDNDGVGDLLVGGGDPQSTTAPCVTLLLGRVDGSFLVAPTTPLFGGDAYRMTVADLNGDGKQDVALMGSPDSTGLTGAVCIMLGEGGGAFGSLQCYETEAMTSCVTACDPNEDGRIDLAVACMGDYPDYLGTADVLVGNGDGTLASAGRLLTGAVPWAVAFHDLNGDSTADLITANYTNSVSVLLADPDGGFEMHREYATGRNARCVAVTDLNRDGKPDLITANLFGNSVSVLLGAGGGTFAAHRDFTTALQPYAVAVGDFNGDGIPDVAVATAADTSSVSILLGNGDGTFGSRRDYVAGMSTRHVAVGDLNGDGKPDLVLANEGSNTISVLLGNGDGTFGQRRDYDLGAGPQFVVLGDFNSDGRLDAAVANSGSHSASVMLGNGDGTFGPRRDYAIGSEPWSMTVADLDGDGRLDLATANTYSCTVSVLLGRGDGTFGARVDYGAGYAPCGIVAGDLERDGLRDLAVVTEDHYVTVLRNEGAGLVGTDVTLVVAHADPSSVRLEWYAPEQVLKADVQRRTEGVGWSMVGEGELDGSGYIVFEDRAVRSGMRYNYRVDVRTSRGEYLSGESWVEVPGAVKFGLEGVRPNPSEGPLTVSCSLPSAARARLELLDVRGRRVLERDVVGLGPGHVLVRWEESRALAPGLYFLRLSQAGRSLVARVCVIR
jgi:hypothetical protein